MMRLQVKVVHQASFLGRASQSSVVNVEMWVITGKAAGVKVVQVNLVVLVKLVQGKSLVKLAQDKLLVQGMSLVKFLVQGMPQVNLVVLVNPMQHKAQQLVKWELTGILCKHVVVAIYNMFENSMGLIYLNNGFMLLTDLKHRHMYTQVNPRNGRGMWPVVEFRTVIIQPLYKPQVGKPPKKRKKLHDEITSESCSSGKLSRKGKSIKCGKCRNVGHNRKGCRGQGGASQPGGSSQAGARKVSGQASARQAAGARNVSGQVSGARNASS
nr:hypothetical protein [Tanacetum cinerariifolium]